MQIVNRVLLYVHAKHSIHSKVDKIFFIWLECIAHLEFRSLPTVWRETRNCGSCSSLSTNRLIALLIYYLMQAFAGISQVTARLLSLKFLLLAETPLQRQRYILWLITKTDRTLPFYFHSCDPPCGALGCDQRGASLAEALPSIKLCIHNIPAMFWGRTLVKSCHASSLMSCIWLHG